SATMWLARRAYTERTGDWRSVKKLELDASGGAPRAICVGSVVRIPVPAHISGLRDLSHLQVPDYGCFFLFPGTTQRERKRWRIWCDAHPQRTTNSKRARRRWLSARVNDWDARWRSVERTVEAAG